jgi:hypothetical protein
MIRSLYSSVLNSLCIFYICKYEQTYAVMCAYWWEYVLIKVVLGDFAIVETSQYINTCQGCIAYAHRI